MYKLIVKNIMKWNLMTLDSERNLQPKKETRSNTSLYKLVKIIQNTNLSHQEMNDMVEG